MERLRVKRVYILLPRSVPTTFLIYVLFGIEFRTRCNPLLLLLLLLLILLLLCRDPESPGLKFRVKMVTRTHWNLSKDGRPVSKG